MLQKNIGIVFDANGSEKIESNDTDLTINSGADINLTATFLLSKNISFYGRCDDKQKIDVDLLSENLISEKVI